MPPVLINKILKSTSPSSSSSHGSDIATMTTTEQDLSQQQNNGGDNGKKLTILHYNDVYNIDTQGKFFLLFLAPFRGLKFPYHCMKMF